MTNDRHELDKRKSTGAGADRAAKDQQHTNHRAHEESREQGHQDTAGGNGRDKPKDDPSRAPESGTP